MNPKEKSDKLIENTYQMLKETLEVNTAYFYCKLAAQSICDEIIKNGFNPQLPYRYWEQVKEEIEKL